MAEPILAARSSILLRKQCNKSDGSSTKGYIKISDRRLRKEPCWSTMYQKRAGKKMLLKMKRENINLHIEKEICICYNASRQKAITFQCEQRIESPSRVGAQSGDSSLLFTVAKHPPGYLLSLWSPSNHLMMKWQTS